jgi:hypothetical protein
MHFLQNRQGKRNERSPQSKTAQMFNLSIVHLLQKGRNAAFFNILQQRSFFVWNPKGTQISYQQKQPCPQ